MRQYKKKIFVHKLTFFCNTFQVNEDSFQSIFEGSAFQDDRSEFASSGLGFGTNSLLLPGLGGLSSLLSPAAGTSAPAGSSPPPGFSTQSSSLHVSRSTSSLPSTAAAAAALLAVQQQKNGGGDLYGNNRLSIGFDSLLGELQRQQQQQQQQQPRRKLSSQLNRSSASSSSSSSASSANNNNNNNPNRYKTELCRPFQESGHCKYGDKCQFAHGKDELRQVIVKLHRKVYTYI